MRTKDVMTAPALYCSLNDSLEQVAAMMWDYEIDALPVVDPAQRAIGWVTDRAICMTALRQHRPLSMLTVAQAMLPDAPIVHQGLGIGRLERRMAENHTPWLAVLDDAGCVAGVVTTGDIERALRKLAPRAA
jgi:predicted transcriptional regulator